MNLNKDLKMKIDKLEKENEKIKNDENNLKEQIEIKEKELIQSQIKLKELKAINSANNLYNTNYRTKSFISKSNSSINIYKDNLTENKENLNNYYTNSIHKKINNSLYNNIYMGSRYTKIKMKRNNITNPNVTLNNLTLSLQNLKKKSNSKSKKKKKYNNSINYFNKNMSNNLTTIFFLREPKNKYKKKARNTSLTKNRNISCNNINNKSMLDLFPSRNLNYIFNNNKYINNNIGYNNNSNKNKKKNIDKKKSKSLNITHNTINMNKNNVMINLNANIINTNTPIEKFKVQQKLLEYKKYINKKLNEFNKKNKKNLQIIPPPSNKSKSKKNNINFFTKKKESFSTCSVHYKRINKYLKKNKINDINKRRISPYQNAQNIKLNLKKPKVKCNINIINASNNNIGSRSSSNNSKSSLNIIKKSTKNKIGNKIKPTLKNFVFSKNKNN